MAVCLTEPFSDRERSFATRVKVELRFADKMSISVWKVVLKMFVSLVADVKRVLAPLTPRIKVFSDVRLWKLIPKGWQLKSRRRNTPPPPPSPTVCAAACNVSQIQDWSVSSAYINQGGGKLRFILLCVVILTTSSPKDLTCSRATITVRIKLSDDVYVFK